MVRGVLPFRIPSIYTKALGGTLSRNRTPVACGGTVVLTTTRGLMITDGGAVVVSGLIDRERIDGSGTSPAGTNTSPAKTGTDNKRRRTSVPIRRQESSFMYSPEEVQGTLEFLVKCLLFRTFLSASMFLFLMCSKNLSKSPPYLQSNHCGSLTITTSGQKIRIKYRKSTDTCNKLTIAKPYLKNDTIKYPDRKLFVL
jgi:hypothetical protein